MPQNSETVPCSQCGSPTPIEEANADGECCVCAALLSLRASMIKTGAIHPNLFQDQEPKLYPEK